MGIKKDICKMVGESILAKDLYEYKKDIKDELEQVYMDEIKVLKEALVKKQKQIDELIVMVKEGNKESVEDTKTMYNTVVKENAQIKNRVEHQYQQKEESRFPFYSNNRNQNWAVNQTIQAK